MDMTGLNMLAGWTTVGDTIMIEQMPILGGYTGGVEETAICDVATTLGSFACFSGNFHLDGPIHIRWGTTMARGTLQVAAHAAAAIDANTDLLLANQYYPIAGPCTEMCLLETPTPRPEGSSCLDPLPPRESSRTRPPEWRPGSWVTPLWLHAE